jgi:general secretion pathway protein G
MLFAVAVVGALAVGVMLAGYRFLASRTVTRCPPKVSLDIMTLVAALAEYRKDHGDWPDTLEVLVVPDEHGWTYLDRRTLPLDPWKRPYRYDPPTENEARGRVYTLGRDGVPGGAGDDADVDSWSIGTR